MQTIGKHFRFPVSSMAAHSCKVFFYLQQELHNPAAKLPAEKAFCILHSFVSSAVQLKYGHHPKRQEKWIKESGFYKTALCHQYIITVINTGQNYLAIIRAIFLVNIHRCYSLKPTTTTLTHGYYYCFALLLCVRQTHRNLAIQCLKLQNKVFLY